jgi:hypothetical protein
MKYRKLTEFGDYTFGQGAGNFIQDTPETVGQAVKTRLALRVGEWMLDTTIGTPYDTDIIGAGKITSYDSAFQEVILDTQGVTGIADYSSGIDPKTRQVTINCTINTMYGASQLQATI